MDATINLFKWFNLIFFKQNKLFDTESVHAMNNGRVNNNEINFYHMINDPSKSINYRVVESSITYEDSLFVVRSFVRDR